ncbi:MAG: hypothetical protein JWO38_2061 [Gemmataceae bacterium]|nr:hypothetical protein [Gemmataceae bacterium]
MHDQTLADAANALSRAIAGRWNGWYAVGIDRDKDGAGMIRVSFDQDHVPALAVHAAYNGYRVDLRPTMRPGV